MPTDAELWALVHEAFEAHRQRPADVDAHTAFERVAQKCLGLSERRHFNAENSDIRMESLSRGDLDDVIVYHERSNPQGRPEIHHRPIVIIEIGEGRFAIDGNNRLNLWRDSNQFGPFEVIIVEPVSGLDPKAAVRVSSD